MFMYEKRILSRPDPNLKEYYRSFPVYRRKAPVKIEFLKKIAQLRLLLFILILYIILPIIMQT